MEIKLRIIVYGIYSISPYSICTTAVRMKNMKDTNRLSKRFLCSATSFKMTFFVGDKFKKPLLTSEDCDSGKAKLKKRKMSRDMRPKVYVTFK